MYLASGPFKSHRCSESGGDGWRSHAIGHELGVAAGRGDRQSVRAIA
jgi:hypothetical protein